MPGVFLIYRKTREEDKDVDIREFICGVKSISRISKSERVLTMKKMTGVYFTCSIFLHLQLRTFL